MKKLTAIFLVTMFLMTALGLPAYAAPSASQIEALYADATRIGGITGIIVGGRGDGGGTLSIDSTTYPERGDVLKFVTPSAGDRPYINLTLSGQTLVSQTDQAVFGFSAFFDEDAEFTINANGTSGGWNYNLDALRVFGISSNSKATLGDTETPYTITAGKWITIRVALDFAGNKQILYIDGEKIAESDMLETASPGYFNITSISGSSDVFMDEIYLKAEGHPLFDAVLLPANGNDTLEVTFTEEVLTADTGDMIKIYNGGGEVAVDVTPVYTNGFITGALVDASELDGSARYTFKTSGITDMLGNPLYKEGVFNKENGMTNVSLTPVSGIYNGVMAGSKIKVQANTLNIGDATVKYYNNGDYLFDGSGDDEIVEFTVLQGENNFHAKLIEDDGSITLTTNTISVSSNEYKLSNELYNRDFNATGYTPSTSDFVYYSSDTPIAVKAVDEQHGNSIAVVKTKVSGTNQVNIPNSLLLREYNTGIITVSADVYFNDFDFQRILLGSRYYNTITGTQNSAWWSDIVIDTSGNIKQGTTTLMAAETNKWYNIMMVVDFDNLIRSFYIDGICYSYGITNLTHIAKGNALSYIQFGNGGASSDDSFYCFDNVAINLYETRSVNLASLAGGVTSLPAGYDFKVEVAKDNFFTEGDYVKYYINGREAGTLQEGNSFTAKLVEGINTFKAELYDGEGTLLAESDEMTITGITYSGKNVIADESFTSGTTTLNNGHTIGDDNPDSTASRGVVDSQDPRYGNVYKLEHQGKVTTTPFIFTSSITDISENKIIEYSVDVNAGTLLGSRSVLAVKYNTLTKNDQWYTPFTITAATGVVQYRTLSGLTTDIATISAEQWHNYKVIYDLANNAAYCYFDGVLVGVQSGIVDEGAGGISKIQYTNFTNPANTSGATVLGYYDNIRCIIYDQIAVKPYQNLEYENNGQVISSMSEITDLTELTISANIMSGYSDKVAAIAYIMDTETNRQTMIDYKSVEFSQGEDYIPVSMTLGDLPADIASGSYKIVLLIWGGDSLMTPFLSPIVMP